MQWCKWRSFSINSLVSVALTRIELSFCSLTQGLWWVNDISASFSMTEPAFAPSPQCSGSSQIQQFYVVPIINILPFWIRFLQVILFFPDGIIILIS